MDKRYNLKKILHGQCYADEEMKVKISCEKCLNNYCILHPLYNEIEHKKEKDTLKVS